jgi:membrane-associated phospholipid phosphatase
VIHVGAELVPSANPNPSAFVDGFILGALTVIALLLFYLFRDRLGSWKRRKKRTSTR